MQRANAHAPKIFIKNNVNDIFENVKIDKDFKRVYEIHKHIRLGFDVCKIVLFTSAQ